MWSSHYKAGVNDALDPRPRPPSPRVALATSAEAWSLDEDAPLLTAALTDVGLDARGVVWDDPDVDWSAFELVVIRSTWDYATRHREFIEWTERVQAVTDLRNPAAVIAWNTDKRYLADLADDGVAVTPTTFLTTPMPEAEVSERIAESVGSDRGIVVKPTVSAGSKDTARYASRAEDPHALGAAATHAASLLDRGRAVMVQPYLDSVDDDGADGGETGLVFLGGTFSHAFRKGPLLALGADPVAGLYAEETISAREPKDEQLAVAATVLDAARARTGFTELYARVDLLPGEDGSPVLLELELCEPSFFLTSSPGSAARAAEAIAAAVRR